jgi:hypothetical protein
LKRDAFEKRWFIEMGRARKPLARLSRIVGEVCESDQQAVLDVGKKRSSKATFASQKKKLKSLKVNGGN